MLFNKRLDNAADRELPADGSVPARLRTSDQAPAASRMQNAAGTQSVIDACLTITGNLESDGDVRVEGQICGDIRCAHLVVGRDARIAGDIVAEEAVIRGRVNGVIRANRIILQDTACVESDVYHKALCIDEGASFNGQSCRTQDPLQDGHLTSRGRLPAEALALEPVDLSSGAALAGQIFPTHA